MIRSTFTHRRLSRDASGKHRRGAVVVELAIVLPFLILLIAGVCEMGQALRVESLLTQAVRKGCASASLPGRGNSSVIFDVKNALVAGGLPAESAKIEVLVNDLPANAADAHRNDKITVIVEIPYAEVTWSGTNLFMGTTAVQSKAITMLKQG